MSKNAKKKADKVSFGYYFNQGFHFNPRKILRRKAKEKGKKTYYFNDKTQPVNKKMQDLLDEMEEIEE